MLLPVRAGRLFALIGMLFTAPSQAAFHLWDINEIYSNADGSVQFIELIAPVGFNSEHFIAGHRIFSNSRSFTFPTSLPTQFPTGGRTFLVATPAYATTPGAVPADYTLPAANFFSTVADTLNFDNLDIVSFSQLPTDGRMSINRNQQRAVNSPKNFLNQTGSLTPLTPGDLDGDGDVDERDVVHFTGNYGLSAATLTQGDLTGDGRIGVLDVGVLQSRLTIPPSGSSSAVPEPSTVALALAAAGILWLRRFGR